MAMVGWASASANYEAAMLPTMKAEQAEEAGHGLAS